MGQVEMRQECARRGLVVYGASDDLKKRLVDDDTRGEFEGDLDSFDIDQLRQGCSFLGINSSGSREQVLTRLRDYNSRKIREQWALWDATGTFNDALPTPDDRLGPPNGEPVRGTLGSGLYLKSYHEYIRKFVGKHHTTEHALTLDYWRSMRAFD